MNIAGNELEINKDNFEERANRIVYLTPPHSPSIVTTISNNGTTNIGSFEQTMLCSNWPPIILLAISPKSDTLKNILDEKECVIGFPYPENRQLSYDLGVRLEYGNPEAGLVEGINFSKSKLVKPPRLDQCWASFEAKLCWAKEAGDHTVCAMEVEHTIFDKRLWSDSRVERRTGLPALYYATSGEYGTVENWEPTERSSGVIDFDHAD